jgi:hypothetical protein
VHQVHDFANSTKNIFKFFFFFKKRGLTFSML